MTFDAMLSDMQQADVDNAMMPRAGDGAWCAFDRAAKAITANAVENMKHGKVLPPRRLTDDEFDDEQARINDDWNIQ